jgi:hypothetical protein
VRETYALPPRIRNYNRDIEMLDLAKSYERLAVAADDRDDIRRADTFFMQFGRALHEAGIVPKLTIEWKPGGPS